MDECLYVVVIEGCVGDSVVIGVVVEEGVFFGVFGEVDLDALFEED